MNIDQKLMEQMTDSPTRISIEKLIGEDLFAALSEELGGRRIYIPHSFGENSPLAVCIGKEATAKMASIWGGMEYNIPLMVGRKRRIMRLHETGMPIVRISHHLKISISTVQKVVSESRQKDQLLLDL